MKQVFTLKFHKLLFLLIVSSLSGCNSYEFIPQEGDLLFQIEGTSDFSAAITEATAQHDSLKFAHVAIVALDDNGKPYIIEASSEYGVTRTEWEDFLTKSRSINDKPGVVVMRINTDFPAEEAINRAKSHIGEEYDWSYRPDNGKMYCSELVYDCFLDRKGEHLFTANPMNFRNEGGEIPAFWTALFEGLGETIPEGVPGTNPNDMAKSNILTEVHRYF